MLHVILETGRITGMTETQIASIGTPPFRQHLLTNYMIFALFQYNPFMMIERDLYQDLKESLMSLSRSAD